MKNHHTIQRLLKGIVELVNFLQTLCDFTTLPFNCNLQQTFMESLSCNIKRIMPVHYKFANKAINHTNQSALYKDYS